MHRTPCSTVDAISLPSFSALPLPNKDQIRSAGAKKQRKSVCVVRVPQPHIQICELTNLISSAFSPPPRPFLVSLQNDRPVATHAGGFRCFKQSRISRLKGIAEMGGKKRERSFSPHHRRYFIRLWLTIRDQISSHLASRKGRSIL